MGNWPVATLVALAYLLTATGATAAQVEYVTGTGSAGPNSLGSASATCPTFDYPTGGGSFSSGGYLDSYVTALELDSDPIRETHQAWSWGINSVQLTSVVACVDHKITYKTKQLKLPAGKTGLRSTRCPDGYSVVGGEVTHTAPGESAVLHVSKPNKKLTKWHGQFFNHTTEKQVTYVTAACATGKFAKKLSYHRDKDTIVGNDQGLVTTDCPQGSKALSGGVVAQMSTASVNSTGVSSTGEGSASYVDAVGGSKVFNYLICVE